MLSQIDIVKALGKSIAIHPFNEDNLKENSYNLTASEHAFATTNSDIEKYKKIKKGKSCVMSIGGAKQIILLPRSTTLVVTEEILGVTSLGGTYHSKVGLASAGLGHIGTMLGPNFCGHSLVAVHNISDEVIQVAVGTTFASVVFHKLDTPMNDKNATVNAHLDKFSQFGITEEISSISQDWKTRIKDVTYKMCHSVTYKEFRKKVWRYRLNAAKSYLNLGNVFVLVLMLSILGSAFILDELASLQFVDREFAQTYHSFFYNIALSGVGVVLFQILLAFVKRR